MNNVILKFDKTEVSDSEIQEHIDWYLLKVEEGYNYLKDNQNKSAMAVLREINRNLEQEYKYYQKTSIEKIIVFNNDLKSRYCGGITKAYIKQTGKNSYDMLSSNFYDISDYIGMIKEL